MINESGVPLGDLAIEQAEKLANMANDMHLDIDSLEALTVTRTSNLTAPETVDLTQTIKKRNKTQLKKETRKALTEAKGTSNSMVEQLATGQAVDGEDETKNADGAIPTRGIIDPASTLISGPCAYSPAEIVVPALPLADIQPTSSGVVPIENLSGVAGTAGKSCGDLPDGVPVPEIYTVDVQRTPSDIDPVEDVPKVVVTADEIHANHPTVRRDSTNSEGIAEKEGKSPCKIGYNIDGLRRPASVPQDKVFTGGSKNLAWAYATHTVYDYELRRTGVWLFEKPKGNFKYQPRVLATQGLGVVKAPTIVLPAQGLLSSAKQNFDGQYLHVTAYGRVRDDIRSLNLHPDFMTAAKVSEFQACEAAGQKIWRHDRDLLSCRMIGCRIQIADSNPANIICLGCGPKTMIRYCSVQHLLADMEEHWKECSHKDLVIKQVIDHTTEPPRFSRLCPALRDRNGFKSYANYRQRVYAQITYGHYTLFDFGDGSPITLVWPDSDPQQKEMESRVERTLSLALFDHTDHNVLVYLYKLLRKCLRKKGGWVIGTQHALRIQFLAEFEFDPTTVLDVTEDDPLCECEWIGVNELPKILHLTTCQKLAKASGKGKVQPSLRGLIEWMEAEYWILRAWRQQHPTATHWRERAVGIDFPDVDLEEDWEPYLGAGWEGHGAEEDMICG